MILDSKSSTKSLAAYQLSNASGISWFMALLLLHTPARKYVVLASSQGRCTANKIRRHSYTFLIEIKYIKIMYILR